MSAKTSPSPGAQAGRCREHGNEEYQRRNPAYKSDERISLALGQKAL